MDIGKTEYDDMHVSPWYVNHSIDSYVIQILTLSLPLFRGEEYETKNLGVVAEDEETMTFPNDLKVDKKGTLWVLSTPLPEFFFSNLNSKNTNFRIFTAPVRQAIKGTVCDEI
ncbi:hypothetical protein J6590_012706 [Homalodisca vitripennis]|nr:hypothetical protein J6590_012706 [Homalodisca vitripennis]